MQYTTPSDSGPALTVRHTGQEFPLTQAPVTIGRQPDCTVVLADPQVSRQHAAISYQAGRYIVQDMGSANGTYVNDRRVAAPQALRDGDQLRLGNTIFDVRLAVAGGVAPTMYGQPVAPYAAAPAQAAGRGVFDQADRRPAPDRNCGGRPDHRRPSLAAQPARRGAGGHHPVAV